jgi:hypothetical protein
MPLGCDKQSMALLKNNLFLSYLFFYITKEIGDGFFYIVLEMSTPAAGTIHDNLNLSY